MWCVPWRGRRALRHREPRPWCAEAEAFCTRASGVCLVSLKALTSPPSLHLHLHSSAGPLRCSSPHSTITLPLLNIYGSQETRSQHQLFYSHTFFFNRLGSSLHNFVFHGFLGGESETSSKFYSCWSDKTRPCGFTDKATVPSCGHGG